MSRNAVGAAEARIKVERTAVRVLPVNDRGEVLLLLGFEPAHPDRFFWFSVGGGTADGEQDREAAVRELAEETGIVTFRQSLLGSYLSETAEFSWGDYDVTQHQTWWAVPGGDVPVSFDGLEEIERATTVGHRGWTPDDVAAAAVRHAPGLIEQMRIAVDLTR